MIVGTGVIVIEDKSRFLLTQRAPRCDFGWMWECPGGKVRDRELIVDAIHRELKEEVGLIGAHIDSNAIFLHTFAPGEAARESLTIEFHLVYPPDYWRPVITDPTALIGFGWFRGDEAMRMQCLPGNVKFFEAWKRGDLPEDVYW